MTKNKTRFKYFYIYFFAGFFLSVFSIHWLGAKNSFRVREISIGIMVVLGLLIAILRMNKIIDIEDTEYQKNPPWWVTFILAVVALIMGHALGFFCLKFIGQLTYFLETP